jgi:acyl-coenzyme A thioesterase PaaI-like protein
LRSEGCCIRLGKSICYSEARVYDEDGELIAHGTSTLMILPGKGLETDTEKFL